MLHPLPQSFLLDISGRRRDEQAPKAERGGGVDDDANRDRQRGPLQAEELRQPLQEVLSRREDGCVSPFRISMGKLSSLANCPWAFHELGRVLLVSVS